MSRPDYSEADTNDKIAYIGSRSNVLNKSFVTDLWMKVIHRAIDDIVTYRIAKEQKKSIKEEEIETVNDAYGFLFHDEYKIPFDDYLVEVECQECELLTTTNMSNFTGGASKCLCGKTHHSTLSNYKISDQQPIKEVNLREILQFWGIEDMVGFRSGVRERITELMQRKKEASIRRANFKLLRQLEKELKIDKDNKIKRTYLKDTEEWREYDYEGRVYRIEKPVALYSYKDSAIHKVVDSECMVHCVPAPGERGCVVRCKPVCKSKEPIKF